MLLKPHLLTLLVLLAIKLHLYSQTTELHNQVIINKYLISPAYAGFTSNNELFFGFRKNWFGMPGSPEGQGVNFNGPLSEYSSYGAYLNSQKFGIFENVTSGLGYSYHFKINEHNKFFLGLSFEYSSNRVNVDFSNSINASDPYVFNSDNFNNSYLNTGAGLLYIRRNFQLGIAVPNLRFLAFNKNAKDNLYNDKAIRLHSSYIQPLNNWLEAEALVIAENYSEKDFYYNSAVLIRYDQTIWCGANLKSSSVFGAFLGATIFKNLILNYSFETSNEGLMNATKGSHEISLGVLIGTNKSIKYRKSAFGQKNNNPYYNWIK